MPRLPIVTLTTDFGLTDSYVAEMKAVLLGRAPGVAVIDVTHGVPPQDVLAGSFVLDRALRAFPAGTIHVAVVDPGVGSARRLLAVEIYDQYVLCPDNGLITWPWRRPGRGATAREIVWRPPQASSTFHGRDILAPVAAMLARGKGRRLFGPTCEPILLSVAPAADSPAEAQVIHVDHFGNATTNVPAEAIASHAPLDIRLRRRSIGPVRYTYADVGVGKPIALIGSSGLLEIAVRNGSAARALRVKVGDRLTIHYRRPTTARR
jgi:S-adenosylmethionine hydrolase